VGTAIEQPADGGVIGPEEYIDTMRSFYWRQSAVARHRHTGTMFGDGFRVAGRSIAVDDQTRVAAQHQGCVETGREAARHVGRPGIPANMIGQMDRLEAKGAEPLRDPVGGVITDEHSTAQPVGIDRLDRGRLTGQEQRHGSQARKLTRCGRRVPDALRLRTVRFSTRPDLSLHPSTP
jgi:hypothetical protein